MTDKLGPYINKLMTTIIDNTNEEDFVKELAWAELNRLNINIEEFLRNHSATDDTEKLEKTKQLLQEESKNGKNGKSKS